jgi:hypothetical protein
MLDVATFLMIVGSFLAGYAARAIQQHLYSGPDRDT